VVARKTCVAAQCPVRARWGTFNPNWVRQDTTLRTNKIPANGAFSGRLAAIWLPGGEGNLRTQRRVCAKHIHTRLTRLGSR
jgi:hypothetical protein